MAGPMGQKRVEITYLPLRLPTLAQVHVHSRHRWGWRRRTIISDIVIKVIGQAFVDIWYVVYWLLSEYRKLNTSAQITKPRFTNAVDFDLVFLLSRQLNFMSKRGNNKKAMCPRNVPSENVSRLPQFFNGPSSISVVVVRCTRCRQCFPVVNLYGLFGLIVRSIQLPPRLCRRCRRS